TSIHCEINDSITSITPVTPEQIVLQSENVPISDAPEITNSNIYQPICTETKSLEDIEIDKFLDSENKKKVSNEISCRNRERNLSTVTISSNLVLNEFEQNDELISPQDKNLIVEQELTQQLSVTIDMSQYISAKNNEVLAEDTDSQNLDSSSVSVQSIVHIFREAVRSSQKTILCWHYVAEKYDKRVDKVSIDKKIGKKKAMGIVYDEVKWLLPEITDVNLRQKLLRARKIRMLVNAVGVEKIKQVSYSANAISNLSYPQIQNIIDHVLSAELERSKTKIIISPTPQTEKKSINPISRTSTILRKKKKAHLKPLNCLPSEEEQTQAIESLMNKVPCIHLENIWKEEGKHRYDEYWMSYDCVCPLCKKKHQWVLGKWWINEHGQKLYFLTCDNSKPDDTGILLETMSPHNHTETCSCFTPMSEQSSQVLAIPDQSLITCPS
ncbi:5945_t:CDS:1, partial [Diversispora eburnea]